MTICAALTMAGLGLGLVFVPAVMTILAIFFGSLAALGTWVWLWRNEGAKGPRPAHRRTVVDNALMVGAATGAVIGLGVLLGASVLLLLVVVLAISPCALRVYGRWLLAVPTRQLDTMARALAYASPEYLTFQPSSVVDTLTDEELCQSWRASYTALQHQPSTAQTAAIVAERQTYLDELERRNPRGFAAWLAAGARAPGNPLPYLTRARADQPPINWDELTRGQDW